MMKKTWIYGIRWSLAVMFVILSTGETLAVRPADSVLYRLQTEGRLDEYHALEASARRRGLNQPDTYRLAAGGLAAVTGNLKVLVILVDFSDNSATGGGSYSDSTYFNDLLFSTNTPGYSMNDHYSEMSYGLVTISGRSVGWTRMSRTYAYYVDGQRGFGNYPQNAQKLAEDAVDAAEALGVDFSQYDNDGDGQLDGLFVVHAGPGYEATGDLDQIHSHKWNLAVPRTYDGIQISTYTMEPEEQGNGRPINVGVYSHEFGHFLGLPDLYDTDYSSSGLGRWCLMASGSWANGGTTPAHMSAWCKYVLGWLPAVNVTVNMTGATLPQVQTDAVSYRLWTGGQIGSEYYLVENRQAVGFDRYLRGAGLCIYHIDEAKSGNQQEWYPGVPGAQHYRVAMEQADGDFDLELNNNGGDDADPFPGSLVRREFSEFTAPDSRAYSGASTEIAVWEISDPDSLMTANLDIYFSQPHFDIEAAVFSDDGNANGRPDPGEQVSLVVTEINAGAATLDAGLLVATDDPAIVFADSTSLLGAVATGELVDHAGDPFLFSVPTDYSPRITDFYITVTADSGTYAHTDTIRIAIGPDQILVVDDDARLTYLQSHDSAYILPVLDSLRIPYARWEVKGMGAPGDMSGYPMVLWYTGDKRTDPVAGPDTTLTVSERAAIAAYLDGGGHLWLTGQQIAFMLDSVDSAFMHDYLHAAYGGPSSDFIAAGVGGDLVGGQTKYVLGGTGGAQNQHVKDLLIPVNGGIPTFHENVGVNDIMGVRYEGSYRVLFLGFGVEGIGDLVAPQFDADPKSKLITRAIDWLLHDAVQSQISLQPLGINPGQDPTHVTDTSIELFWSFRSPQAEPQDSLEVQVGVDTDWTTAEYWSLGPQASSDTTVPYGGPSPLPGHTYYWRVRVFAGDTWSDWNTHTWHMNAAPAAPYLSTPGQGAIATRNGPQLRTNNAGDPEGDICTYRFEVYEDSSLTNLLAAASNVPQGVSTTAWTVDVTLAEQERFWWRVRAHDGYADGGWSGARSFWLDGINETPTAPSPTTPMDSALLFTVDLDLAWAGASDPDLIDTLRYRVHLDTLLSMATADVYDAPESQTLRVPGRLESGRTYYWSVTVFDKGGLEATSAVRMFQNRLAGDATGDGGLSTGDVVFLVNYVFKGGPSPDPTALADVDADCSVASADVIYLVNFIFRSGPAPVIGCAE